MFLKNRLKCINDIFCKNNIYTIDNAINILKSISSKKFIENIEIYIKINSKKKELIHGYHILPNKNERVLCIGVFCENEECELIKSFGADFVGIENLLNVLNKKKSKINILLSSKETMNNFKKSINNIKNKNLLPNKKMGTLVSDIKNTIDLIKNGFFVNYKSENNIIKVIIGKSDMNNNNLKENINSFIKHIEKYKINIKNFFIKNIFLSSTMGVGIKILK